MTFDLCITGDVYPSCKCM